jgi:hypothetical protein
MRAIGWFERGVLCGAAALALHACKPITSCGCTPFPPPLAVRGTITGVEGGPASGAPVTVRTYTNACATGTLHGEVSASAGDDGTYAVMTLFPRSEAFCLRVTAAAAAGSPTVTRDTTLTLAQAIPAPVVIDVVVP